MDLPADVRPRRPVRPRLWRGLGVVALVAGFLVARPSPVHAQAFTVSAGSVAPGGTVGFSGEGCFFNPAAPFFDAGPQIGIPGIVGSEITIESDTFTGTFTGTIAVPSESEPGDYQVTARCARSSSSGAGPAFDYPPQALTVVGETTLATTTTSTSAPSTTTTTTAPCSLENPCPDPVPHTAPGRGVPVEQLDSANRTPAPRPVSTSRSVARTGASTDRHLAGAALLVCLGSLLVVAGPVQRRGRRRLP